jgi:hypothetical protein
VNAADMCGAVEVSEDRHRASIALAGVTDAGMMRVDLVEYDIGPIEAVGRVEELTARWRVDAWAIDPASPAGSLLLQLASLGIRTVEPSARQVAAACGVFLDAVRDGGVRAGRSAPLKASVKTAEARRLAGALAWDRKAFDAGPVLAVSLASWASANCSGLSPDQVYIGGVEPTPRTLDPAIAMQQAANWPLMRTPPALPPLPP